MPDYVRKFSLAGAPIHVKDKDARDSIEALPQNLYAKAQKGKNILFIGDSWTVGSGASDPATERFSTVLCGALGMNEYNYGVGAAGYARPLTFQDQATAAISGMTAAQKNNTNIIMVVGGVNDLRNIANETFAQVTTAINTLINTLLPEFPNAVICFAINSIPHDTTTTMMDWITEMEYYFMSRNQGPIIYFDSFTQILTADMTMFNNDLLHPTTSGYAKIAGYFRNAILGGLCANPLRYVDTLNFTRTGYSLYSGGHIFTDGKFVYIEEADFYMTAESGNNNCGTIPEGVRPLNTVYFPIFHSSDGIIGAGQITKNGAIYINQNITQANGAMCGCIIYPCAK